jgi:hypothetical protein
MKKKLKDRIVMHKNNEALMDLFSPEAVPPSFGGTLEFDFEEWLRNECEADGSQYVAPALTPSQGE